MFERFLSTALSVCLTLTSEMLRNGVSTTRFSKYVPPFYDIVHERVKIWRFLMVLPAKSKFPTPQSTMPNKNLWLIIFRIINRSGFTILFSKTLPYKDGRGVFSNLSDNHSGTFCKVCWLFLQKNPFYIFNTVLNLPLNYKNCCMA